MADEVKKGCFFFAAGWRENAAKARLEAIALELVRRGHEVVIIVDGQRRHIVNPNTNPAFYTWPSPRPIGASDALFLADLIRSRKPDCLVAHFGAVNLMLVVGRILGVKNRIAWQHTLSTQTDADTHLSAGRLWFLRVRKRAVFGLASLVVANSQATKIDLLDVYHTDEKKIRVEHIFLVDPFDNDLGLRSVVSVPGRVVCVGQIRPSKGQDILVRAAVMLSDCPGFEIEFVGSGENERALHALASELGVANLCTFTRSVPHADVFRKMALAAVCVVPSRDEAFGLVCVEALAVGTPVVGSNVGGIPEIIRDGLDGFLVPPEDPEALASALRGILESEETRSAMKSNARKRFLDSFEAGQFVQRQANWLEDLLSGESK